MNIVIIDGGTLNPGDLSWEAVAQFGSLKVYAATPADKMAERARGAEILIVNKVTVDRQLLEQLPNLQYIAVTATGYNNIDTAACAERGVLVSNVVNYGSSTVAQHVFALLLELTNRTGRHRQLVREGQWRKSGAFSFWDQPLTELSGKTMGIIGYGNIGQKVGRIAAGFEMEVLYASSKTAPGAPGSRAELRDLIARSDVISLNTHLHAGNASMVNREFLHQMKNSAFLINTARGGLIDEAALAEALREGTIAGAGLDVLGQEPPPDDHPLLQLDRCVVTPHNAWASVEARRRMLRLVAENIRSYLDGRPIHLVT